MEGNSATPPNVMPAEIRGWNWGAFFLNWIWGLSNSTYIALLMFVPFVNLIMPFVLGAKGNEWAWRNGYWRDVAHFKKVQRNWAIAALISIVATIAVAWLIFSGVSGTLQKSVPYQLTTQTVLNSATAQQSLGAPIHIKRMISGSIDSDPASGNADFEIKVEGANNTGVIYSVLQKKDDAWSLQKLDLVVDGTSGQEINLLPSNNDDEDDIF